MDRRKRTIRHLKEIADYSVALEGFDCPTAVMDSFISGSIDSIVAYTQKGGMVYITHGTKEGSLPDAKQELLYKAAILICCHPATVIAVQPWLVSKIPAVFRQSREQLNVSVYCSRLYAWADNPKKEWGVMKMGTITAKSITLSEAMGKWVTCRGMMGWLGHNQRTGEYEVATVVGKVMRAFTSSQLVGIDNCFGEIVVRIRGAI